jgi:hypothetical protein
MSVTEQEEESHPLSQTPYNLESGDLVTPKMEQDLETALASDLGIFFDDKIESIKDDQELDRAKIDAIYKACLDKVDEFVSQLRDSLKSRLQKRIKTLEEEYSIVSSQLSQFKEEAGICANCRTRSIENSVKKIPTCGHVVCFGCLISFLNDDGFKCVLCK